MEKIVNDIIRLSHIKRHESMKKKFLCLLLALTFCLQYSSVTVKPYEQISQENQEREACLLRC